MMLSLLADAASQSWNPFAPFGVTSWQPFVSNLIAFLVIVVILRVFAFKPIRQMLQLRRDRIAEGEAMRAESERKLKSVEKEAKDILVKARQDGQEQLDLAKETAARTLQAKEEEARTRASLIVKQAQETAARDNQLARDELKKDFARLVALATSQVAGKVLTEEDHKRINQELIDKIPS